MLALEGFGWVNASFEVGADFLTANDRAKLAELKPPPVSW
jgi:hypothetical protein